MFGEIGEAAIAVFLVGSFATLTLAGLLALAGDDAAAAGVILLSPFPCPSGLPC